VSVRKELYNSDVARMIQEFGELTKKTTQSFDEVRLGWQDMRQREFYNKYIDSMRDEMIVLKSDLEMLGHQLSNLQSTLNNLNN
jgi:hypothetical protein